MIASESPGGRFIIATPTKCGTTTLEELTRRHGGGRVSRGGVQLKSFRILDDDSPRRQHRMVPPDGWEDADRYIIVRNPFARYVSIFKYLSNRANYSKWGAMDIQRSEWAGWEKGRTGVHGRPMTFPEFLTYYADSREFFSSGRWGKRRGPFQRPTHYRSPWVWLDSLKDSHNKLQAAPGEPEEGVNVICLERLWDDLEMIKTKYDLGGLWLRRSIHANKTLTYPLGDGGLAVHVEGDAWEPWHQFYGPRTKLCNSKFVEKAVCKYVRDWGGLCPACRLGIRTEGLKLGYGQ